MTMSYENPLKPTHIEAEMPNYNGLSRAATIPKVGMPLVPTIVIGTATLMLLMFLMPFIGANAWLIVPIGAAIELFVWQATKKDDQMLNVLKYQALWFLRRRNYFLFGKTNTILATKYGRQENDYVQFFEEINGKTQQYQPKYAKK